MQGDKSPATEKAYGGVWAKWRAWARRQRWLSEYLDRSESTVERENKLLGFVGYLGWLGASVNTIRQNIYAIKMAHKRVGPGMSWMACTGCGSCWGAWIDVLRPGVLRGWGSRNEMLQCLGKELIGPEEPKGCSPAAADASMAFAALSTVWFFIMRCKEFAESNGVDKDMILRLEQWLQLQTLEMAKVTGQALECQIWLHT